MATTLTIENTTRNPPEPVVIHLPHLIYCAGAGDCRCDRSTVGRRRFDADQKRTVVEQQNQRTPGSISLNAPGTPGSKLAGLHPAIRKTPDFERLLAARKIRVSEDKVAPPKASPLAPAAPPEVAEGAAVAAAPALAAPTPDAPVVLAPTEGPPVGPRAAKPKPPAGSKADG